MSPHSSTPACPVEPIPRSSDLVSRWLFPSWLLLSVVAAFQMLRHGMPPSLAPTLIAVVTLTLVAVMERVKPFEPRWNRSHGDVMADISSLLVVLLVMENLFAASAPLIAGVAYSAMVAHQWIGPGFLSQEPLLVQVCLLLLFADLAKYVFHRFGHEHRIGWRLHSVHHAVKRVYWLNGFRIHPLYHTVNFIIAVLPWMCLGASAEAVALHTSVLVVLAAFQHANINLDSGGFINHVFNTNELHRWHHSTRLDEANANYGAVLVVWDIVFGTYRPRTPGQPHELGMVNEQGYPMHSYWGQLGVPFRAKWWRQRDASPH